MNETEQLKWVAEHLVSLQLNFNLGTMVWLDNEGYEHSTEVLVEDCEDVDILKALIEKASSTQNEPRPY